MQKSKLSIAVIIGILVGVLLANVANIAIGTSLHNTEQPLEIAAEIEKLKELTPKAIEEAVAEIIPLIRRRFLMWTHDGLHIMWGHCGNRHFVGTDNLGKRCWGIYGKGIFAGFYDGEFFWGKYDNGEWKAEYLFGLEHTRGRYVIFPMLTTAENVS